MRRGSLGTAHSVRRRDYGALRVPMLAGWLFADLFIVLFIVAFSSQLSIPVTHGAKPTPTPTVSKSPVPARRHKPTHAGLEQNPVNIRVHVSPTAVDNPGTRAQAVAALLSGLHKELAARHLLDAKSGFVLIYATSVGSADPINEAIKVAESIKPILKKQDKPTFGKTSGEGLWGGSGDYFDFQIFFFT